MLTDQNRFQRTHLGTKRNSYVRLRQNSSVGFGGNAITVKTGTIFGACTTRPLGKHLGQGSNKSDQWSRRRCDNDIVTLLRKGQITILKMAAVRPYLLTDRNHFRADTSRHCEEFICKVLTKFPQWFRRRCDNGENQCWPPAVIFVNGQKPYSNVHS